MTGYFVEQVEKKLENLPLDNVAHFAWRCALRALPYLGARGNFNFWDDKNRQQHLYAVLRALDSSFSATDKARAASDKASAAAIDARAAAEGADNITFTATAAAADVADTAAIAASVVTSDRATAAAAATAFAAAAAFAAADNARAGDVFAEFLTTVVDDICIIKERAAISMGGYGSIWHAFQQALENEGCGYWARLAEKWFCEGGVSNMDARERRMNVPPEVQEQGAAAVAKYLEDLEDGATRINEARIIILGDKGAGKTCLARKLLNPDAEMTTPEESTAGVDTTSWKLEEQKMNIRVWDFAGHTVTHAVHKFFLSERCLYVMVYDGRTEQNQRLVYWLDHAKNYGGDSQVLILVNLRDAHTPQIPINTLKDKGYPILDVVFFNLKNDRDALQIFRQRVRDYILTNPSWDIANFPITYDQVKDELAQLFDCEAGAGAAEYIGKEQFDKIARAHRIKDEQQLLTVLHNLGISLWYREMVQYNTMVLNPEWISQGVYQIINWVHESKTKKHLIAQDDFENVFAKNIKRFPVEKHPFLFELMKHYELAYETHCDHCLVIPHLLDEDQPAMLPSFPLEDALMLRYKSDSELPPDTISRFIVRHNEQISKSHEKAVWRYGVILEDDKGSLALVRERDRVIEVTVKGRNKSDYIDTLRATLNDIFQSYKSGKPDLEYRVERIGDTARAVDTQSPIWMHSEKLLNYYQDGVPYYDDVMKQKIPLRGTVKIYRISDSNVLIGRDNLKSSYNSIQNTFSFENCSVSLQSGLNDLAKSLEGKGKTEEARELKGTAELLKEAETCKDPKDIHRSGLAKRLQRIVDALNDKKSKLHRIVKTVEDGMKIAQEIATSYNDIAQWAGLPLVPKPFLNSEKSGLMGWLLK